MKENIRKKDKKTTFKIFINTDLLIHTLIMLKILYM